MSACSCGTKSFLHLADCASIGQKIRNPLEYLQKESNEHPGSIMFYVAVEDSIAMLHKFRESIPTSEWLYTISEGNAGTVTMQNTSEITFITEEDAFVLLELPNSSCIFFEATPSNAKLAEDLMCKTMKVVLINPETKEPV